jgi:hypothetical protein
MRFEKLLRGCAHKKDPFRYRSKGTLEQALMKTIRSTIYREDLRAGTRTRTIHSKRRRREEIQVLA